MYLAVSGHRGLSESTEAWIAAELRRTIEAKGTTGLVGISCVADGADAAFAQTILDLGGRLIAVIPATTCRDGLPASYHPTYDALLS
jgi:predicted Rossmann fold nucleotide-binding protein DprA/Smf involved in DNA uptake